MRGRRRRARCGAVAPERDGQEGRSTMAAMATPSTMPSVEPGTEIRFPGRGVIPEDYAIRGFGVARRRVDVLDDHRVTSARTWVNRGTRTRAVYMRVFCETSSARWDCIFFAV
jgi:hypothetical protein